MSGLWSRARQVIGRRSISRGRQKPPTFVIACLGRVGSENLVALLDSHPDIRCLSEIFNHQRSQWLDEGWSDVDAYLERRFASVSEPVTGCKITWPSFFTFPVLFDLFHDPTLKVIRLKRANLLALHVSIKFAEATGILHSASEGDTTTRIEVDLDSCFRDLMNCFVIDRLLDELTRHNPTFHLDHSQLADQTVLADLQRFLGVEPTILYSPHKKRVARPLSETIVNWDEVVEALSGTVWAGQIALNES